MARAQLEAICAEHEEWVASEGEHGRQADLTGATLRDVDFKGLRFRRRLNVVTTRPQSPHGTGLILENADLRNADLRGLDLIGVDFRGADLRGALLAGSELWTALLQNARLSFARLDGLAMADAQLQGAELIGTKLRGTRLENANLTNAQLTMAQLGSADLRKTNLTDADMSFSDISHAPCGRTIFHRTNLRGAVLREADLRDADLTNVRNACFDFNLIRGIRLSPRPDEQWSELQRSYSGPWLVLSLIGLAIAFAPMVIKAVVLSALTYMNSIVPPDNPYARYCEVNCEPVSIWAMLLGRYEQGLYLTIPIAMLIYNVLRGFLTFWTAHLSAAGRQSERTPPLSYSRNAGEAYFNWLRRRLPTYGWLIPVRQVARLLGLLSVGLLVVHIIYWFPTTILLPMRSGG